MLQQHKILEFTIIKCKNIRNELEFLKFRLNERIQQNNEVTYLISNRISTLVLDSYFNTYPILLFEFDFIFNAMSQEYMLFLYFRILINSIPRTFYSIDITNSLRIMVESINHVSLNIPSQE